MKKQIFAGMMAAAVFATGAVLAADDSGISINGTKLDAPKMFTSENNTVYVPVRAICEKLGMEVSWDDATEKVTISKLPVYITFNAHTDGYTFAKTAPMQLGSAPILEDGVTYVPINFIDEILQAEYDKADNGDINIKYETETEPETDAAALADAIAVVKEDGVTKLIVNDRARNEEVVVNITDSTKITDEDGKALTIDAIESNSVLRIVYSEAMTLSLPPITNAESIVVLNEKNDGVALFAIISSTSKEDGNKITVLNIATDREVVLNVSDETEIVDRDGNKVDFANLKDGEKLFVIHDEVMTKSLPPITTAKKIVVQSRAVSVEVVAE